MWVTTLKTAMMKTWMSDFGKCSIGIRFVYDVYNIYIYIFGIQIVYIFHKGYDHLFPSFELNFLVFKIIFLFLKYVF